MFPFPVLERVLLRSHTECFGDEVELCIEDFLKEKPLEVKGTSPVQFPIEPLVAEAIYACPSKLEYFTNSQQLIYKIERDHILITPTLIVCSDWQEKCHSFLKESFSMCEMEVSDELNKEIRKKFADFKQNQAFKFETVRELEQSTVYTLAGETDILKIVCDFKTKIESDVEESVKIENEHYDFIINKSTCSVLETLKKKISLCAY